MFGQMGQLMQLLKDAPRLAQQFREVQGRLAAVRVVGEAGAGQVRATFDGKGDLVEVHIDPALVQSGDTEMIEQLVTAAVQHGLQLAREAAQMEMQGLMGGFDLGGLMGMLGGGRS